MENGDYITVASANYKNPYNKNEISSYFDLMSDIAKKKVDICCTQEIIREGASLLEVKYGKSNIIGYYRWDQYPFRKFLNIGNEGCPIILPNNDFYAINPSSTDLISESIQKYEKWNPTFINRIATYVEVTTLIGKLKVISTHLGYKNLKLQKDQIYCLGELIQKVDPTKLIIGATWNIASCDPAYLYLVDMLEQNGMALYYPEQNTYSGHSMEHGAVDGFAISNDLGLQDLSVVERKMKNGENTHYMVTGKVYVKK